MRYADLFEFSGIDSKVIDLLSVLSSEGVESIPLASLVDELRAMGVDVDEESLFDEITNISIINNIKDGVVYENKNLMREVERIVKESKKNAGPDIVTEPFK